MRESGFYWVFFNAEWIVAEFDGAMWWIPGMDDTFSAADFIDIGDSVYTPDKYRKS